MATGPPSTPPQETQPPVAAPRRLSRHVSFSDEQVKPEELTIELEKIAKRISEESKTSEDDGENNNVFEDPFEDDSHGGRSIPKDGERKETNNVFSNVHLEIPENESGTECKSLLSQWKFALKSLVELMSTFEKVLFLLGIISAFLLGLVSPYVIYSYGTLAEAFIDHARIFKNQQAGKVVNTSTTVVDIPEDLILVRSANLTDFDVINLTITATENWAITDESYSLVKRSLQSLQVNSTAEVEDSLDPQTTTFALGMAILGLTAFVVGFFMVVCLSMATESFMYRFRQRVLQSLIYRDLTWFEQQDKKQLQELMELGLNRFQNVLGENLGLLICLSTTVFGCTIQALIYGWQLALALFCLLPLHAIAAWFYSKVEFRYSREQENECAKVKSTAIQTLSSIKTVASFSGESYELKRFGEDVRGVRLIGEKKGWMCGFILAAVTISKHVAFAVGFWYGTQLALESLDKKNNDYTTKEVYIVLFSAFVAALTAGQLIPYVDGIRRAAPASFQALQLLQTKSNIDSSSPEGIEPQSVGGKVVFDNVSFCYPLQPETQVLSNFNLTVEAGETVAIVGPARSGKSTILQLLQRFYDPSSGQVTLDGNSLSTLKVGWLRQQVALVESQPILFSTTIRENIRYGRQNATAGDIELAARNANAHDFIVKLPQQYDTIVGEHGTILTDSQKQRVAIARALIRDPKILLLDGATAQFDTDNDFIVQETLEKARGSRTTFLVPHRVSSIVHIDHIVVMIDGKVVEAGHHGELMSKKGIYYGLVKQELKTDKPEIPEWFEDEDDDDYEKTDIAENEVKPNDRGRLYPVHRIRINRNTNWMDASEFKLRPTLIRLLNVSRPYFFFTSLGLLGSLSFGLLFVVFTVVLGHYLGLLARDVDDIPAYSKHYSIMAVVVGIFAGLFSFLQNSFLSYCGERLSNKLRKQMFDAMLHQDMSWFDDPLNIPNALTVRLIKDPALIQEMTSSSLGKLAQIVAMTAAATLITIIYSWKIALVTAMFTTLVVFITCLQTKVNTADASLQCSALEAAGKIAAESLHNIKTLASLHAENVVCTQYKTALLRVHNLSLDMFSIRGLLFGIMRCSPLLLYSAVNSLGGYLIMYHNLAHQKVIVIQQLTEAAFFAMAQTVPLVFAVIRGLETAHRIFQLLDRRPTIDSSVNAGFMLPIRGSRTINFESTAFAYSVRKSSGIVLQNLSLEIPEGKTTAIVGPTGGGKTTCISLMQRFYDPKEGAVMMDQIDMQNLNVPWLRSQIAVISHNSLLSHRTIAENIAYGDNMRQVKMPEIVLASKFVDLHQFVLTLPNVYGSVIEETEHELDMMKKFRIAAARAILRKPKLILVDDVLLTRKPDRAKELMELLDKIKDGRTCVLTSQSVSAVRCVDWVVVLRKKVLETGSPDDLLDSGTRFSLQWQREEQSKSRRPSISASEGGY